MANEIRVLEDQLYDADYQNRVLRDKLERERAIKPRSVPVPSDRHLDHSFGTPVPMSDPIVDSGEPIENFVDEGQIVDPGEPESGSVLPESTLDPGADSSSIPIPVPTPEPDTPRGDDSNDGLPKIEVTPGDEFKPGDSDKEDSSSMLPAPGLPEPPGPDDLLLPPIVPGEILPPPRQGDEPEKPPGQVELPESLQAKRKISPATLPPQKLKIHPGISGGHQFDQDDDVDGLFVVVNALDQNDRMVDLSDFEIDAELTLVVLDPAMPKSEARIGRWDFAPNQVGSLVRSHPVSGLHVPLKWQDARPLGDEVIVHVRLVAGDEEMRCEGRLRVDQTVATAKWTPRGDSIRR